MRYKIIRIRQLIIKGRKNGIHPQVIGDLVENKKEGSESLAEVLGDVAKDMEDIAKEMEDPI